MRDPFDTGATELVNVVVLTVDTVLRFRAAADDAAEAADVDPSSTGLANDEELGVLGIRARMKSNISLLGSQWSSRGPSIGLGPTGAEGTAGSEGPVGAAS